MIERIKTYLNDFLSRWRVRWAVMYWPARVALIGKAASVLAAFVVALWLTAWFAFGPPSVKIGDVTVDLDRSISLSGVDKDVNGIRDDIDNYIRVLAEKKAYNEPQVRALRQDARATQGLVMVDLSDAKAVNEVGPPLSAGNWSGHGFAEVYFNPDAAAGQKVEKDIRTVLEVLK